MSVTKIRCNGLNRNKKKSLHNKATFAVRNKKNNNSAQNSLLVLCSAACLIFEQTWCTRSLSSVQLIVASGTFWSV